MGIVAPTASLPVWAQSLLQPARYKVLYGGRGSAKSWTVARLLLLMAAERPMLNLCARELQVSIKDSVHRLLAAQISAVGLDPFYDVQQTTIRGLNGSEFIFKGLRHNGAEIKSMEGVDVCWVEEAQSVSNASWELLIPTIRAAKSEVWVTFNPDRATDPTYQRFVKTPPPGAIVKKINWNDNKWFPPELDAERRHLQRVDPDAYAHIWGGNCMAFSDAQVLRGKWSIDVFEPLPIWDGPYYGADWGFASDPNTLVECYIADRTLYIANEAFGVGIEVDHTPAFFDRIHGAQKHTVRADSARPELISYMQRHGYPRVEGVAKWAGSVEDGISKLRSFDAIVVHERCIHTAEEMRLYRHKRDRLTNDILPDIVDEHNHCIDAIRYALEPIIRSNRDIFVG